MASPFSKADIPSPLLLPWGPAADHLVEVVRVAPDLASRLLLLPARGLHATAVALQVAHAAEEPVTSLAERLRETHPRELLRAAFAPDGCSPALYRLLDRAEAPAWKIEDYRALDNIVRSRVAEVVIGAATLTPETVRDASALLDAHPVIWRARRACETRWHQSRLGTIVRLLDHLSLLHDLAELPDGSGRRAITRRLKADFGRARCPPDGFPVPDGWSRVETVASLWAIGRRLGVCLAPGHWEAAKHAMQLVQGEAVYLHHPAEDAVAQVSRVADGLWVLVQVSGSGNGHIKKTTFNALREALVSSGLRLLPTEPGEALYEFLRREQGEDAEGVENDAAVAGEDDLDDDQDLAA